MEWKNNFCETLKQLEKIMFALELHALSNGFLLWSLVENVGFTMFGFR